MSALAGIFNRDGAPCKDGAVEDLLGAMSARTTSGCRVWSNVSISLGHGVFATTGDLTNETTLLPTDSAGYVIAGDLRIDNRNDLIRELGIHGPAGVPVNAGELVIAAYVKWGRAAPARFRGAFAFAIWDPRRQQVFCARDHLGAKPFAYHLTRNLFVFASEAEAVLRAPGVPRSVNEARIADFLVDELEGIDHSSSFFVGVNRLPSAHFLVVGREAHRMESYWRPDPSRELRLSSDEAYVERFRAALKGAVSDCLRGQTSVGVMVSGGIDSGAVAATADSLCIESGETSLVTLSAVADKGCMESRCIRETTGGLVSSSFFLGLQDIGGDQRSVGCSLFDFGEPFDVHLVMPSLLYLIAQNKAARTVLDGVDGDVVLSAGGMHLAHLLRRGRLLRASREARALSQLQQGDASWMRAVLSSSRSAFVSDSVLRARRRFLPSGRRAEQAIASGIINRDFARRVDLGSRLDRLDRLKWFTASGDLRRDQADSLVHPYIAVALERYERVAARSGIDLRHPLLDLRLVELCLSMPWHLKTREGWTKYIARRAFSGELPESVCWRRDSENVMWKVTLRMLDVHALFVISMIKDHRAEIEPFVNLPMVLAAVADWEDNRNPAAAETVLQAYSLAAWLRRVARQITGSS